MRITSSKVWAVRLAVILGFALGSILLVSAPGPQFSVHEKAYYADANTVAFVRPGLQVQIVTASVDAGGTIKVQFKLSDPKGLPLDREGIYTPGAVGLRFLAASIPQGKTQYESYVTRTQTSAITGVSAVQAADENNGTYTKVADGEYLYTFKTKAPASFDKTATHTVGITASRDLSEFDLGTNLADTTYSFVPDGSAAAVPRDLIRTVSCNKCHQDLHLHGETGRSSVGVCILCHQPQSTDPDTGNTVDMPVMIHKIHMGEELPSVQAGKPYQIIGFGNSVHDFSDVAFPADVRRCTFCHEQNTGAAQATAYLKPNMDACGACHDNVNFATGENHAGLPQISNRLCSNCHFPEGDVEFDTSIKGAHTIPEFSSYLPGVVVDLLKVDDGVAGKNPTITFSLKNKSGNPILPSSLDRLTFRLVGPTSDYVYSSMVSEDARKAQGTADGVYFWTFSKPIPADAKGSWAIGVEARNVVTLLAGTEAEKPNIRDHARNKVIYFSVDGSPVEPRRTVVALDIPAAPGGPVRGCNACHAFLALHGGNRNAIEECVLCHTPSTIAPTPAPGQSVDFALMVHKIHTGEELVNDYIVGNTNFKDVRFPGDRRNCDWCHVGDSQQLPLSTKLLPVQDPQGLLNPVGPTTAACTACHGQIYAASHALANTTQLGESCAACHGPTADASVNRVHAK